MAEGTHVIKFSSILVKKKRNMINPHLVQVKCVKNTQRVDAVGNGFEVIAAALQRVEGRHLHEVWEHLKSVHRNIQNS